MYKIETIDLATGSIVINIIIIFAKPLSILLAMPNLSLKLTCMNS